MTTLFLDYDGVLHPDAVYLIRGEVVLRGPDGIGLFEWITVLEELLEQYPSVRIVLSTSWVRILGYDNALRNLPVNLQRRVIGATFDPEMAEPQSWSGLTRWEQIQEYVDRHNLKSWLAIDDDDVGWPADMRQHLIHTDADLGVAQRCKIDELRERLAWFGALSPDPEM